MAAPIGPKKVHRYTVEFKIQAVRLSLHKLMPNLSLVRTYRLRRPAAHLVR